MNIAQAVVAGMAAAKLEPGFPGGNIELIMGYEDGRRLNFVKPGQASHRAAAQVHEGLGFKQPQGLAVDGGAGHQCLVVFVNNPAGFDLPCDRIRPPKPALCRVCSYSGPGLPKPTIMLIMGRIIRPPVGCQSARPTLGGPLELGSCGLPLFRQTS